MTMIEYPVVLVPQENGQLRVVARDVPEVLTFGDDEAEALALAADALEVALSFYLDDGAAPPRPSPPQPGDIMVPLPAPFAAKLAVIGLFREAGISKAELARRMEVGDTEVKRLLDPGRVTRIETLDRAARALGRRLTIGVAAA